MANPQMRIMKEFQMFSQEKAKGKFSGIEIEIDPVDSHKWNVKLSGPANSVYEGGQFAITVILPKTYPFEGPPEVRFVTPICSPAVAPDGQPCLKAFQPWKPACRVVEGLTEMLAYLTTPPSEGVNEEIASLLKQDPAAFAARARAMTAEHARAVP